MGLHVAEEFKSGTGWGDTSVAMKHGTLKGVVLERAAILAAARPLVAFGTTSTRRLRGGRDLVSLLGVTTARASWVTWVKACSGSATCTADLLSGGLERVVVLGWGSNARSTHGCKRVIIQRLLGGGGRWYGKRIVLALNDTGKEPKDP